MKCCYIILSCEKYLGTRVKYLLENSLYSVNPNDIYILSAKSKSPNIYGWNTADNYESCPLKYVRFLQNMLIDYDWYYFMDDDTFLYVDRLYKFIQNYNDDKNKKYYIGNRCKHMSYPNYMSGGAGFLLSKSLYTSLVTYIKNTEENNLLISINGDLCMGYWLTNIIDKEIIDTDLFNPQMHRNDDELNDCISFHYLKTEENYKFYKTINENK